MDFLSMKLDGLTPSAGADTSANEGKSVSSRLGTIYARIFVRSVECSSLFGMNGSRNHCYGRGANRYLLSVRRESVQITVSISESRNGSRRAVRELPLFFDVEGNCTWLEKSSLDFKSLVNVFPKFPSDRHESRHDQASRRGLRIR
jgi:hypothetical protein